MNAFEGKDLPATKGLKTYNKTGGKDGGKSIIYNPLDGTISVPTVAPVPGAKDITSTEEQSKGHSISEMDTQGIPQSNNNNRTATRANPKIVEEGDNNGQKQ